MIGLVGWFAFSRFGLGGPGGGALSDWLVRRGWQSRTARLTLMISAAVLMPLAALAVRIGSPWLALGLIALLLGAQSCWMANQLTLISESISHHQAATLLALSAIGGSIGGMVSTLLAGRVIAATGYVPVFTAIGFTHLTAIMVVLAALRIQKRKQRDSVLTRDCLIILEPLPFGIMRSAEKSAFRSAMWIRPSAECST